MFNKSNNQSTQSDNQPRGLSVEPLEERLMLSTVDVFAAGETGRESFFLLVDGEVVETVDNVGGDFENRQFEKFSFDLGDSIRADQISIEFFNDFSNADGVDNNLVVDKIVVLGETFETEAPTTFHTGLVSGDGIIGPGFLESEVLNINGKVTFLARDADPVAAPVTQTGTRIRIDATGQTAEENLQLRIDDQVVANFRFDHANVEQAFFFNSDEVIDPSRIKIAFTNDAVDPVTGADRNVFVRAFQFIDRETGENQLFHTLDPRVFSNNSFVVAEDASRAGFGLGGNLTSTGFLIVDDSTTTVRVDTIGSTGQEVFEVLVDGRVVRTAQASTKGSTEFIDLPGNIDLSRVQVRFVNDFTNPATHFDRNLTVLGFQTINRTTGERVIARGTDANVFSTGTFNEEDGLVNGFGRGTTLTNNGFFQFLSDEQLAAAHV
ncbi:hypothetical protein OAG71_01540 [bacterium]|nr:hypothetical protein [bacterium]